LESLFLFFFVSTTFDKNNYNTTGTSVKSHFVTLILKEWRCRMIAI